jgi:CspA family cold shock protein
VADGSAIVVEVTRTDRGMQAVTVREIRPPDLPPGRASPTSPTSIPDARRRPLEPARVKWFDKAKGFGFANVWGSEEDVFPPHRGASEVGLRRSRPGEAVGLR